MALSSARGSVPDGADSEFAATVVSLPPLLDGAVPEAWSDPPPAPPPADVAAEPTLQHIGRYALKHKLGEGGLGSVYEAWDPLLSRTVAVKTLQFKTSTPERVALDGLFLNEARAVAGLSHPHIVTVYDAGLSSLGVYIAMERLEGRDLRQALSGGWRPSPSQSAQLVRRVADALAYAHARGVVHCDIKPANIFLTRKDRPTVLDFGIARVAHGAQGVAVPALEGLVAGSPHYLAPEQLQGGAIDGRTDVYALGVVLYEMLAGRKAFEGGSLEQIINAVLHSHPAPANEVQPMVPPGLAGVAAKAMARDPDQRYESAAELAQALRPWQDRATHEDSVPPAVTDRPPSAPVRRTRRPLWAAAAVSVLVATGLAWWSGSTTGGGTAIADAAPSTTAPASPTTALNPAAAGATAASTEPDPAQGSATTSAEPAALSSAGALTGADGSRAGTADTTSGATRPSGNRASAGSATAADSTRNATARPRATTRKPGTAPAGGATAPAAPLATGIVQVAVSPWGEIEVDGRAAGITPPLVRLELTEGTHEVTIRNGDFPPYTTRVEVHPDKPAVIKHRFGS